MEAIAESDMDVAFQRRVHISVDDSATVSMVVCHPFGQDFSPLLLCVRLGVYSDFLLNEPNSLFACAIEPRWFVFLFVFVLFNFDLNFCMLTRAFRGSQAGYGQH